MDIRSARAELWYAFVDETLQAEDLTRAEALLSPAEQERSRRFYFEADRREFVVAHALLRTLLSHASRVSPHAWEFLSNRYGKPEIAGPLEWAHLRFNLSHTRGLAAGIVTSDSDVGIDVEGLARRVNVSDLARSVLAPSEVLALERVPVALRTGAFLDYWTLKEAYVKARGAGLSLPLDGFAFDLESGSVPRISFAPGFADDATSWQFHRFRPSGEHWMAVALRPGPGHEVSITCRQIVPGSMWR